MPKDDVATILAGYEPGWDDAKLHRFVITHFDLPGSADIAPSNRRLTLADEIAAIWPQLERGPVAGDGGSLLAFDYRYVVPGGRFRELYYWDSYFTMLGLCADERHDLIEDMIDGFAELVMQYGRIPNGTRSYYLSRSQPPVFYLMPSLVRCQKPKWRLALYREYEFWMSGERAVAMPDGTVLNRYWDDDDGPRDESWAEDILTGRGLARDLRAGAESGWDFSSRWLGDGQTLATIRTTRLIPCDLNALLFGIERELGFIDAAERRRAAMTRWLWHEGEGRFGDWDIDAQHIRPGLTAATAVPLFTAVATPAQAAKAAQTIEDQLLAPKGLRTTLANTGQQWDAPYGWAPLHWFAIVGLQRYHHLALAQEIARRWLANVEVTWRRTGILFEKYDVEQGGHGGGGEYVPQEGFGWTNGVTRMILNLVS